MGGDDRKRKRSRSRDRDRSRERRKSRDRDRRDKDRERDKEERRRKEEKEREEREKQRLLEEEERKKKELQRLAEEESELCERDKRTVFVYHLHPKVTSEMLKEFFDKAGKVRDVRLIADKKTGKSKGFGYIEFYDPSAVVGALALQGYELMGHAVMVKVSEAEKNLVNTPTAAATLVSQSAGSTRLYVGNLNPRISESDLKMVFGELGEVENVELPLDPETGKSRGYAYVKYKSGDDAKKALVQLNGVELANMKIKVGLVNEVASANPNDDSLNARGRALLMAKLQGQTGAAPLALPAIPGLPTSPLGMAGMPGMPSVAGVPGFPAVSNPLASLMGLPTFPVAALPAPLAALAQGLGGAAPPGMMPPNFPFPQSTSPPPVPAAPAEQVKPTSCILLKNLFDPAEETEPDFDEDIKEDVCEECNKYGRIIHVHVDKRSAGHVFMKFDGVDGAQRTYEALNRRWFAKRMITVEFIPDNDYNAKFGL